MFRIIRRCLLWLLVLVVAAAGPVLWWIHERVDEEIRRKVESGIATALADMEIEVQSARRIAGEGIEVRGLRFRVPEHDSRDDPIFSLDELFVACSTELQDLVGGKLGIKRITLRRPRIHVERNAAGEWNFADLECLKKWPFPDFGAELPVITVEGSLIEIADHTKSPPTLWTLRDGQLTITPQKYRLTEESEPVQGFDLIGQGRADHIGRMDLAGRLVPDAGRVILDLKLTSLELGPELLAALPLPAELNVQALPQVRAAIDTVVHVDFDKARATPLDFLVEGSWKRGTAIDDRLPGTVRDAVGTFRITPDGVTVDHASGKLGDAVFALSAHWDGFDAQADGGVKGNIQNLTLDTRLAAVLPENIRRVWHQYDPGGVIQLTFDMKHRAGRWIPEAEVLCEDVNFRYEKFTYRMTGAVGTLKVAANELMIDMIAQMGARPVRIGAKIGPLGPDPGVDVTVMGESIAIDSQLLDSFEPDVSSVLHMLNPSGLVDFTVTLRRPPGPSQWLILNLDADVRQTSIHYERYPYPLSRISGKILGQIHTRFFPDGQKESHNRWDLQDFVARNGTGTFRGSGSFDPSNVEAPLTIRFMGEQIALDDELRSALPPIVVEAWNQIQPTGQINLTADVNYAEDRPPQINLAVEPVGVSIQPRAFPYRIDDVQGVLRYTNNRVSFAELSGRHGAVRLASGGELVADKNRWKLQFTGLKVDRLRFGPNGGDAELWLALPPALRERLEALDLAGVMNMRGDFAIGAELVPGSTVETEWNLALDCRQLSVQSPLPFSGVYGTIQMAGRAAGPDIQIGGELNIDTVDLYGFQLTRVRGPFTINPRAITIGSVDVLRTPPGEAIAADQRRLTGRVVGGRFVFDGAVALGEVPRYHVRFGLVDADLSQYAREAMPGRAENLRGQVVAELDLQGAGSGTHSLAGTGRVSLRNGHVYELPQAVTLLSLLALRPSDRPDLSDGDLSFRIAGPYVYFDSIDLRGDALSLRGAGSMGFLGEVNLQFFTIPGRDEFRLPVVSRVLAGASSQLLRIDVTGTLDNPQTQRRLVPVATDTLQQLLQDLQMRPLSQ
jgi:hypothetical protein